MSALELGAVANRLFEGFLAPLVMGGEVTPGRPIGARAALAMGRERVVADSELFGQVQLARTCSARKLAPVDRMNAPSEAEWALGAALHDLVQAAHPGFDAAFRRRGPAKILSLAEATIARVAAPRSVGESLSRHTWFSRLFELARTDTVVRWWVGSRTFLGESPPTRLSAWPELRRVHVETTSRGVMDLPGAGGAVDPARFGEALARLLAKTPLTDIATCYRGSPIFTWGSESLGLVGTAPGRVLAGRALALAPKGRVDAGLGRATRALVSARAWKAVTVALELLSERAIADAQLASPDPLEAAKQASDDAVYARSAGALVACAQLRSPDSAWNDTDRFELLARLTPVASAPIARAVAAELEAATASSC